MFKTAYEGHMTCKDHPKYTVRRKPKSDCQKCWDMYQHRESYERRKGLGKLLYICENCGWSGMKSIIPRRKTKSGIWIKVCPSCGKLEINEEKE